MLFYTLKIKKIRKTIFYVLPERGCTWSQPALHFLFFRLFKQSSFWKMYFVSAVTCAVGKGKEINNRIQRSVEGCESHDDP